MSDVAVEHKPEDYKWIAKYGKKVGKTAAWIDATQKAAAKDQAPLNAIYYCPADGHWRTAQ